ncbi:EamA family transporter [Acidianus sulfidivorans JP7]|uniref:Permease n=1 Tax=Acidianus sulfidivorans JP7 TaxID=619593 RepID=A0A2U9IJV9_9CREN|nr:EamA family transporter [Acidianus sulfidivorans]AWR96332.1 EamA family transporter [Acidianus sulfidivorans JP7]
MSLAKGISNLTITAFLWGTIGIVTQIGYENGANSFQIILVRSLVSSLSIFLLSKKSILFSRYSVIMGIITGIFYETYIFSIEILGASLSAVFLYTAPIWVVLMSKFTKDKITYQRIFSAIIVVLGVYLIYFTITYQVLNIIFGLLSGLTYGLVIVFSRIMQLKRYSNYEILASQSLWSIPIAVAFFSLTFKISIASIYTGLYLGLIPTFLGYILFYNGMKITDSIIATVITSLEPVFTILLAMPILHIFLSLLQIIGSALVLLGSIIISIEKDKG